jgi:hypothetical protein
VTRSGPTPSIFGTQFGTCHQHLAPHPRRGQHLCVEQRQGPIVAAEAQQRFDPCHVRLRLECAIPTESGTVLVQHGKRLSGIAFLP